MAGCESGLSGQREGGSRSNMAEEEEGAAAAARSGSGRSETGDEEDQEESGSLDVHSPRFDPYLALYSRREPTLPFPNVRTFNNMAEYESFLQRGLRTRTRTRTAASDPDPDPASVTGPGPGPKPATGPKSRTRRGARPPPDPERIERLKKLMVAEPSGEERPRVCRRERAPKNVLTRMALHEGSPLGELYRCVQDRIKISVHIRTFKGLRGVCSGFLVAFDKFWNMALVDVDETFRKPILGKAFYNEPVLTVSRLFDRLMLQERCKGEEPCTKTVEQTQTCSLSKRFEGGRAALDDSKSLSCVIKTEPAWVTSDPLNLSAQSEGSRTGLDDSKSLSCVVKTELVQVTPDPLNLSAQSEAVDLDRSKRNSKQSSLEPRTPTGEKQKRKKKARPRVDYQQVSQRHVKQLFIRGENILLISLMQ
ncbi:U7 snRNA-associated Sm-like protein LSm11 [Heptranchias perlo]|uniref:U7 snRNA-associated Sm-like protein LSm11 n=1 Tax=Heptranchias perlo TaxID=212740 RepID=UPI003559CE24